MADDCIPKCGEKHAPISAASIIYKGQLLSCIGADIPDTLESIVKKLDTAICQKLTDINALNRFINTGAGIELYLGQTVFGQNELATLSSPDNSVNITYNETTKEVNIEVDFPAIQDKVFTSTDESVNITSVGNEIDLSVVFPPEQYISLTEGDGISITTAQDGSSATIASTITASYISLSSDDNSVIIEPSVDGSSANLKVIHPDAPIIPEQVQSNVTELDVNSKAFIQNQNPTKSISANYTLTSADNNYVIVANSTSNNITITVPTTGIPTNNYFVGIIQKGGNLVTINGADIIPTGYENKIEGNGHNAAIDIIEGDVFLLGSLKETV